MTPHHLALADALRRAHPSRSDYDSGRARHTWMWSVRHVATVLHDADPGTFNPEAFRLTSCPPGMDWVTACRGEG